MVAVLRILSVLLAFAALGKVFLLLTEPFADLIARFPVQILWVAVVVEFALVLAVWRCRSFWHPLLWMVYFTFFILLLTLTIVRSFLGYADCGCYGLLTIPNYVSIAINVAIVVALILVRPKLGEVLACFSSGTDSVENRKSPSIERSHVAFVGGMATCLALYAGTAFWPLSKTIDYFSGQEVIRSEAVVVEQFELGETMTVEVPVKNDSQVSAKIRGTQSSCTCLMIGESDASIDAMATTKIPVKIRPIKSGRWHQRIVCFLDHPEQTRFEVDLTGTVIKPKPDNGG